MMRGHPTLRRAHRGAAWAAIGLAALAAAGCTGTTNPNSDQATRINNLWWGMFGIAVVVGLIVLALIAYALFRPRRGPSIFERRPHAAGVFTLVAGGVVPVIILAGVFGWSLWVVRESSTDHPNTLVVNVSAHQWAYDVTYPAQGAAVSNVLHLPAHRPVKLELISTDVIHSFWVPEMNGKVDMFPNRTTVMHIDDPQPGTYREKCAEFCGVGHSLMQMDVIVEPQAQFDAWIAAHQASGGGQ